MYTKGIQIKRFGGPFVFYSRKQKKPFGDIFGLYGQLDVNATTPVNQRIKESIFGTLREQQFLLVLVQIFPPVAMSDIAFNDPRLIFLSISVHHFTRLYFLSLPKL